MVAHKLLFVVPGWQAALMAPVGVLAQQHFRNICNLISDMPEPLRPSVELLTGSTKVSAKDEILSRVASGKLQILVGTHALLTARVDFKKLGLAVVDEQHK